MTGHPQSHRSDSILGTLNAGWVKCSQLLGLQQPPSRDSRKAYAIQKKFSDATPLPSLASTQRGRSESSSTLHHAHSDQVIPLRPRNDSEELDMAIRRSAANSVEQQQQQHTQGQQKNGLFQAFQRARNKKLQLQHQRRPVEDVVVLPGAGQTYSTKLANFEVARKKATHARRLLNQALESETHPSAVACNLVSTAFETASQARRLVEDDHSLNDIDFALSKTKGETAALEAISIAGTTTRSTSSDDDKSFLTTITSGVGEGEEEENNANKKNFWSQLGPYKPTAIVEAAEEQAEKARQYLEDLIPGFLDDILSDDEESTVPSKINFDVVEMDNDLFTIIDSRNGEVDISGLRDRVERVVMDNATVSTLGFDQSYDESTLSSLMPSYFLDDVGRSDSLTETDWEEAGTICSKSDIFDGPTIFPNNDYDSKPKRRGRNIVQKLFGRRPKNENDLCAHDPSYLRKFGLGKTARVVSSHVSKLDAPETEKVTPQFEIEPKLMTQESWDRALDLELRDDMTDDSSLLKSAFRIENVPSLKDGEEEIQFERYCTTEEDFDAETFCNLSRVFSGMSVVVGDRYISYNEDTDTVYLEAMNRLLEPDRLVSDIDIMPEYPSGGLIRTTRSAAEDSVEPPESPVFAPIELGDEHSHTEAGRVIINRSAMVGLMHKQPLERACSLQKAGVKSPVAQPQRPNSLLYEEDLVGASIVPSPSFTAHIDKERVRVTAENRVRRAKEEEERRKQQKAKEAELKRLAMEAEAERRRKILAEKKRQALAEVRKRKALEAENKRKALAEAAERKKKTLAAQERKKKARAEEAERKKKKEEAERKKKALAEEAERKKKVLAEEAERKKKALAEEAERKKKALAEEAERKKQVAVEAERKKKALALEAERKKQVAVEAQRKKKALAEEAERKKKAAEEAERKRQAIVSGGGGGSELPKGLLVEEANNGNGNKKAPATKTSAATPAAATATATKADNQKKAIEQQLLRTKKALDLNVERQKKKAQEEEEAHKKKAATSERAVPKKEDKKAKTATSTATPRTKKVATKTTKPQPTVEVDNISLNAAVEVRKTRCGQTMVVQEEEVDDEQREGVVVVAKTGQKQQQQKQQQHCKAENYGRRTQPPPTETRSKQQQPRVLQEAQNKRATPPTTTKMDHMMEVRRKLRLKAPKLRRTRKRQLVKPPAVAQ